MKTAEDSQEYSYQLRQRLQKDRDFYERVRDLCILAATGISDEIQEEAHTHLEKCVGSDIKPGCFLDKNLMEIYLIDDAGVPMQSITMMPTNFRSFKDCNGDIQPVSMN